MAGHGERACRIQIFSTCPASTGFDRDSYVAQVVRVAQWSERARCEGILVYTDNSLVDPWLVAQLIIQHTDRLCPLVAVQPVYMHPYTVAKLVATLGFLYRRRLYLNMVAGGFKNDLQALNDPTPHDQRYERLVEYTMVIKQLLAGTSPVTFDGQFYKAAKLKMVPPLSADLFPGITLSGSSEAGLAAAKATGAIAIHYPKPAREYVDARPDPTVESGIRIGIISRPLEQEAWDAAHAYFPEDRRGQLAHQLAMKVSDSSWHKQLSEMEAAQAQSPYWLVPFQNYKTACPYLVGSYERVAQELWAYLSQGYRTFILDVPPNAEELDHTLQAFRRALERLKCRSFSTSS